MRELVLKIEGNKRPLAALRISGMFLNELTGIEPPYFRNPQQDQQRDLTTAGSALDHPDKIPQIAPHKQK